MAALPPLSGSLPLQKAFAGTAVFVAPSAPGAAGNVVSDGNILQTGLWNPETKTHTTKETSEQSVWLVLCKL